MLEFENCDDGKQTVIKKECLDADNVDENITNCSKSEDILRIKCEEIDIKEELDIKTEISESDYSQKYDNVGNNASSNSDIKKTDTEGKKHFCPKCSYSSNRKYCIKQHNMRVHLNNKQHFLKHTDMLEIYKCTLCPFISKYRSALMAHQGLQHEENLKMYKCKECSFTTKYRKGLLNHQLVHADPTVVNKFKCEKCPHRCKRQCDLNRHMMTHTKELVCNNMGIYKCELCSYQTKTPKALKAHKTKTHPNTSTVPQKCAHCGYKTTSRHLFSRHMKRQHSDKDQGTLNCTLCPYTTTQKKQMWNHSLMHKNPHFNAINAASISSIQSTSANYTLTHIGVMLPVGLRRVNF